MLGIFLGFLLAFLCAFFSLHPNFVFPFASENFVFQTDAIASISFLICFSAFSLFTNIFFIPDSASMASILPMQHMVLNGKAKKIFLILSESFLVTGIISFALHPIFNVFYQFFVQFSLSKSAYFIAFLAIIFILSEKSARKMVLAFFIWIFSGLLGVIIFNHCNISNPTLPLLSGFFGLGTIFISNEKSIEIPKQKQVECIHINPLVYLAGNVVGWTSLVFPSVGLAPALLIFSLFKLKNETFLALMSSASLSGVIYSVILAYDFGTIRNGAVFYIFNSFPWVSDIFIFSVSLASVAIVVLFINIFSDNVINFLANVDVSRVYLVSSSLIILGVYLQSGTLGLLVMSAALSLSIFSFSNGVKRTHCLASLIIPVMLTYL